MRDIFVSRPTWISSEFQPGLDHFLSFLKSHELNPRTLGASDYPSKTPMDEVIKIIKSCCGTIILGYPQIQIEKGVLKGEKISEMGLLLPTEWNHIEAALSYANKLPLLVIHHIGVKRGIFDRGTISNFIYERDLANHSWSLEKDISGAFSTWKSELIDKVISNREVLNSSQRKDESQLLEKIEEDILLYLSRRDRAPGSDDLLREFKGVNRTKLEFHVENLRRKNYLNVNQFQDLFYLEQPGRAYLVKNSLI